MQNQTTPARLSCLRGLILDLDGVLADTEDIHRQAYNLAFREAGISLEWSYDDYRSRLIQSAGSKLQGVTVPDGIKDRTAFLDHLYERKRQHYLELIRSPELKPRPGIVRLVDEALECGVALASASTCAREGAMAILDHCLGAERVRRFIAIRAGDDAPRRKPAPDIYLLALEDLALPPENCIAIEDSLHGLEAAHAAGLWTLVTPSQYTVGDDFSPADQIAADLDQGNISIVSLDRDLLRTRIRNDTGLK